MGFWFYDVDMQYDYRSHLCKDNTIIKSLCDLSQTEVNHVNSSSRNTLDKIKCLQHYLKNQRPTIIEKDLYCGEVRVILRDNYDFCYIDKLGDTIVMRGILFQHYIEYEYNNNKLSGNLTIHSLSTDEVKELDKVNSTIFAILEKIMKKHNIIFNKLEVF